MPLQVMKDWHKIKLELFKKQPYYLTECDTTESKLGVMSLGFMDATDEMGDLFKAYRVTDISRNTVCC